LPRSSSYCVMSRNLCGFIRGGQNEA
jgi:hypothetical protein